MKQWMAVSNGAIDLTKMEMLISLGDEVLVAERFKFFDLSDPTHLKGLLMECRAAQALKLLKNQNVIVDFKHSQWGDVLDRKSVDFEIVLVGGKVMSLQIKSSQIGLRKHKKVAERYGLDIPALVVRECDDVENIAARLTRMVKRRQKKEKCFILQGFESAS